MENVRVIQTETSSCSKILNAIYQNLPPNTANNGTLQKQHYCTHALMKWISLSAILQKESMTFKPQIQELPKISANRKPAYHHSLPCV
jgi:hypothetical protein